MSAPRAIRSLPTLLLLSATLLAGGCTQPRRQAEKLLARAELPALRHDAAVLYKDAFATSSQATFVTIPPEVWPKNLAHFAPKRITAYPDGIALVLETRADRETGLLILPDGLERQPTQTDRARFEKLRDGIYWYEFGRQAD